MSTTVLRPVADGDLLEWTPSTGTAHYALVDEATADDNDYLTCPAAYTKNDRFTLGTLSLPAGSVITKVTITARAKDMTSGSSRVQFYFRSGGVNATFPVMSGYLSTAFANYDNIRVTNPLTGQMWTVADLSGATIQMVCTSGVASGGTRVSQVYVTVTYIAGGSASVIARPNADKALGSLVAYPTSPATGYDKIDEVTENTADYVHIDNGAGTYGTFDLDAPSGSGSITHVVVHAKVQATATGGKAGVIANTTAFAETTTMQDTNEHEITCAQDLNPLTGVAWVWGDIAAMYANVTAYGPSSGATKIYQVWVEIFYTPPVYFDSIVCNSAGNRYVAVSGVLRSDASTPAKKQAQVASDSGFGTILADSTELTATETPGNPMVITFSWTPASTGTYYARLGVRSASEAVLTWITLAFVVTFPAVAGITVAQAGEHATVTVTVTDNYMDPPEVTIFIDGQAVKGNLN